MEPTAIAQHLRTLQAVRERCRRVYALAERDGLTHYTFHPEKLDETVAFVEEVIASRFSNYDDIPYHSRWRHFEVGDVDRKSQLESKWPADMDWKEAVRRRIDLAVTSVLLDAGAGAAWSFREESTGKSFSRSEGLGVASFYMFDAGLFSSNASQPHQADAEGLSHLSLSQFITAFQVSDSNPLVGGEGRCALLQRLGRSLADRPDIFASKETGVCRPGNILDRLLEESNGEKRVSLRSLWRLLMDGLEKVWPASRTQLADISLGDAWPYAGLGASSTPGDDIVVFHKLTQWLTYSLLEPLEASGIEIMYKNDLTGLAEYRNGGLLLDMGVLVPRDASLLSQPLTVDCAAIIEWRAMTVCCLDELANRLRARKGLTAEQLPLAKMLEGGTWYSGRVIAKKLRPETSGPPLNIVSDGTVF